MAGNVSWLRVVVRMVQNNQTATKGKRGGDTGNGFKPGQSGNPGGRKKIPEDIKEAFQKLTPKAVEVLGKILNDKKSKPMEKIKAAEVVLDRALGKATQPISGDEENPIGFKITIVEKELK
jgi:hypothetical protein